mmetsp:Transcript_32907/g.88286  ORF Transcript_32907/g.88286 Transcript_32907/m.88286 type:complete len:203 (+) Transcript_32907:770-1378(+)
MLDPLPEELHSKKHVLKVRAQRLQTRIANSATNPEIRHLIVQHHLEHLVEIPRHNDQPLDGLSQIRLRRGHLLEKQVEAAHLLRQASSQRVHEPSVLRDGERGWMCCIFGEFSGHVMQLVHQDLFHDLLGRLPVSGSRLPRLDGEHHVQNLVRLLLHVTDVRVIMHSEDLWQLREWEGLHEGPEILDCCSLGIFWTHVQAAR